MSLEALSKILQFIRLPPKLVCLLVFVCGFFIFTPDNLKKSLSIESIRKEYSSYIGVGFILFSALLCIEIISWIGKKVRLKRQKSKYNKYVKKKMLTLDPHEKSVLREFFLRSQRTIRLPIDNPTVSGLLAVGILEQTSSFGPITVAGTIFPICISDVAYQYLTPSLINLPTQAPTQEEVHWLRNNRPDFTEPLDRWNDLFR